MRQLVLIMACFTLSTFAMDEVVENGLAPKGAAKTLQFTEVMRMGGEDTDDDNYIWASLKTRIAVTHNDQILVADPKTNELRLFDQKGKFIKRVAGPGAGPGEMQALNGLTILNDGSLMVFEQKPMFPGRFQLFDKNMEFVKVINAPGMGVAPIFASVRPDGKKFSGMVIFFDPQSAQMTTATGILGMDTFSLEKKYTSFDQKMDMAAFQSAAGLGDMMGETLNGLYKEMGIFAYDRDNNLYAALSSKYEVTKWSPDMSKKLLSFSRKYKPLRNSPEEVRRAAENLAEDFRVGPIADIINDTFIERVIEKAQPPELKNPIDAMMVMPEGHILVVHDSNVATGKQTVDIFDQNGEYQGQVSKDNYAFIDQDGIPRMVFKDGMAYTVETDEDDNNTVVAFRYKLTGK